MTDHRAGAADRMSGDPRRAPHEWARRVLEAEEEILASCTVDYNGTLPPNQARVDAAIADVDPEAVALPPAPETLVAFPAAKRMALVLTPTRLVVLALGFGGAPKKLLDALALEAIESIGVYHGAYGDHLCVVMASGAVVDLEHREGDPAHLLRDRFFEQRAAG
jgi:hypothetical protein